MSVTVDIIPSVAVAVDLSDPADVVLTPTTATAISVDIVGSGIGDMQKTSYDPTLVEADAFDLANHTGNVTSDSVLIDAGLL